MSKNLNFVVNSAKLFVRIQMCKVFKKIIEWTMDMPDNSGILTWMCVYVTRTEIYKINYLIETRQYKDAQDLMNQLEKRFQMKFEEIEALL